MKSSYVVNCNTSDVKIKFHVFNDDIELFIKIRKKNMTRYDVIALSTLVEESSEKKEGKNLTVKQK